MRLRYRKGSGERGSGDWQSVSIPEGNMLIGRRSGCSLQLPGQLVSREHAEIRRRGDRIWLVDLGSSNGTRLDGKTLEEQLPQQILPGQTIQIGEYTLIVDLTDAAELTTRTDGKLKGSQGHIFISYSRKDKELVYPLAQKLEDQGIRVWIDKQDIRPGAPWRGQIVQAINEADAFVLLLSPDSCASENVLKELDLAIEADTLLLPVILQPVQITPAMKYQLVGIQQINLFNQPEAGFSQLAKSIRERQAYLEAHPRIPLKELQVELILPAMQLNDFYLEKQQQLLGFLAQVTHTSPAAFSIASVTAGSVHVAVNMPASAAYEMKAQALNANPALAAAGIGMLRLVSEAQFIHIPGTFPPGGAESGGPGSGEPPSGAPPHAGSPPAAGGGSGVLKILLLGGGALGVVVVVVAIALGLLLNRPDIEPPSGPSTPLPPTLTLKPGMTDTVGPTLEPTLNNQPAATKTKTPTRLPTLTSTATQTVFVCAPYLIVNQGLYCREGPGTVYDILTSLNEGDNVPIEGKNDNSSFRWWWVPLPNSRAHCWVSDPFVQTFGEPECVPVIPAPPTPTPTFTPSPTNTSTPDIPIGTQPVTNTLPSPPQLFSPINNEIIDCSSFATVTMSWSDVSVPQGIRGYEGVLEMADTSGNYSLYNSGFTSDNTASFDLPCATLYRWTVRTIDSDGVAGDYAGYAYFETN